MKKIWIALLLPLMIACQSVQVPIRHMRSAKGSIPQDVKAIAILPFIYQAPQTGEKDWSSLQSEIPDQISAKITSWGTYTVVERAKIKNLMKEKMIQMGPTLDEDASAKVAKLASAQALVHGKILNVNVTETRTTKQIRIEAPQDPDLGPQEAQIREYPYLIRRVTLSVSSEMLHVDGKTKILTDTFNQTYDSERDPKVTKTSFLRGKDEEYYRTQVQRVPAVDQIVKNLVRRCVKGFLSKISAHPEDYIVQLKTGSGLDTGLDWAKRKQYDTAIQEFSKYTNSQDSSAEAWFNIAVCREALGQNKEAIEAYRKSDSIKPSPKAKDGIARIRSYYPQY